jgi:hypothetical protein
MKTNTKEALTSQALDKRDSANENMLFLNGEKPILILTEYEFARALGYIPI